MSPSQVVEGIHLQDCALHSLSSGPTLTMVMWAVGRLSEGPQISCTCVTFVRPAIGRGRMHCCRIGRNNPLKLG